MAANKEWLKLKSGSFEESFSEKDWNDFAKAVGAQSSDLPTFSIRLFWNCEKALLDQMGLSLKQLLHGGQKFEYLEKLKPGTTYQVQSRITHVFEKKGKLELMTFVVVQSELQKDSQIFIRSEKTIIVRGES